MKAQENTVGGDHERKKAIAEVDKERNREIEGEA